MKKETLITIALLLLQGMAFSQLAKRDATPRFSSLSCGTDTRSMLVKAIDTSDSRGVADNYYLWDNNSTIIVKFMPGGSERLRNYVKQYVREWEQHTTLKFQFVPDTDPQTNLRVLLGKGKGHNSYVGTMNNLISQREQTMNLDTTDFVDFMYYVQEYRKQGVDLSKYTDEQFYQWFE